MIYINEWLPNPMGLDTQNEWVELFNGGEAPVSLSGWVLKTQKGKAVLGGIIDDGGYAVLKRSDTKLVLRNTDEKLFLYNVEGKLVDSSEFLGAAQEGKSFSRLHASFTEIATKAEQDHGGQGAQNFTWSDPTPGAANAIMQEMTILQTAYVANASLNRNLSPTEFSGLLVGVAVSLAIATIYALKKHEKLSKLFFGRDEAIR